MRRTPTRSIDSNTTYKWLSTRNGGEVLSDF